MQAAESGPPDWLEVTPSRIERLVGLLRGRDAQARVLRTNHGGLVGPGSRPDALTVGAVELVVPANARITIRTRDAQPGIDVNSDNQPEPPGTWIWIGCSVVAECHQIYEELAGA
jgi:hypothetical protein